MAPDDIPFLPRGVRRHFDSVRRAPVLLGPERVLMLDDIGCAILDEVDGTANLTEIADNLAQKFDAPVTTISADVSEFLLSLADKKLLELRNG